ncbi:hypothetical protein HDU96_003804 [Phlyctochytrium bullatum]|nr:hypothetical protein HDU96_003804 [Phlyctochytrium bullatum]
MVQPIAENIDQKTDNAKAAPLSEIQAQWPEIKQALQAKKAVDDAFASVLACETAAFDLSKEISALEAKKNPIGDLIHARKKKISNLRVQMDQEFRAMDTFESRGIEMSQEFLRHKAAYDVLEAQMSAYLHEVARFDSTGARLHQLRVSRGLYDVAKARFPNYRKAEELLVEIVDESVKTRRKLMMEYNGTGGYGDRGGFGDKTNTGTAIMYVEGTYVDKKTQKDAIGTAHLAVQKSEKIFELCPDLPPHTIEP